MGCRVYYNGVYDIPTKCRFMRSEITPNHAIVELVSFPALVPSTVVLVYITKIKNPSYFNDPLPLSSEIMDANLKINIFNIDPTIGPYYFDYFNLFADLRIGTFTTYDHTIALQSNLSPSWPWVVATTRVNT